MILVDSSEFYERPWIYCGPLESDFEGIHYVIETNTDDNTIITHGQAGFSWYGDINLFIDEFKLNENNN